MPQTMLAILALAVIATFALTQHRNRLYVDQEAMKNEIAVQATAVALDQLELLGRMPFDDRINGIGSSSGREIYSANSLTLPDSFTLDAPSNDLDDFDGLEDRGFRTIDGKEVWYEVRTDVQYVDEGVDASGNPVLEPVSYKTKMKRALVKTIAKDTLGINDYVGGLNWQDTVVVSQTYTCGSWCDWD